MIAIDGNDWHHDDYESRSYIAKEIEFELLKTVDDEKIKQPA